MKPWFAAKTHVRHERSTEAYLVENLGINVFLPMIRPPLGQHHFEPLFPTYLFCQFDPISENWPSIRSAPGLAYVLGNGSEPVPVCEELILDLKRRVSFWNSGTDKPRFYHGEPVAVISGPFSGFQALFENYLPARQRCQVLIEVLGQLTKVELPAGSIDKVVSGHN
jgi:transcriptional antiterminator RfaH